MKEYKLIKINDDLDVSMIKCANPRVGMVFLSDCVECNKYKGMSSLNKHVKCSFEYDNMQEEYDTDNVEEHGCIERVLPEEPDCGSDCVCKEEVEKSCSNCYFFNGDDCENLKYSGCVYPKFIGWKPKHTENKLEKVNCLKCKNVSTCKIEVPGYHCPKVEKVKKYKYACKSCKSRKCKLIIAGSIDSATITYCPISGDAKWKLKGEA